MRYLNDSGVLCDVFGVKESEYGVQMAIILVAEGYFLNLEVKSTKNLIFSHISCRQTTFQQQFMKVFLRNHHLCGCILQGLPHIVCYHHDMCDRKCHHYNYVCYNFCLLPSHILIINETLQNCFETIVRISRGHAPGHHDFYIRFSKWLLAVAHPSNCLRYNRDFLYITVSKVQWCVYGHWIPMQSYEVNILIALVVWFDPGGSVFAKLS